MTTRSEIENWLRRLYEDDDLSHMIVVCDTFDYEDYPAYVKKDEDVRDRAREIEDMKMQRLMEVYSKTYTLEDQMAERRAFHFD